MSNIHTMSIFAQDVLSGLSAPQKYLSSKYFYDAEGSRLFQQIMDMPEYYLTNSELEILQFQSDSIFRALQFEQHFNIIELGAGDGKKTFHLLKYLTHSQRDFTYIPIDISSEALHILQTSLQKKLPELSITPIAGDYFKVLKDLQYRNDSPSLLLFLGSNIGNYTHPQAIELLQLFGQHMQSRDKLLIGVDLQKNPHTIHQAYSDPHGITRAFNINLLTRINRELDGNFDLAQFDFYCYYNPLNGEVRSFLISLSEQEVLIRALQQSFHFKKNELIATELSKKYTLGAIEALARQSGFEPVQHFLDKQRYFTDSLWMK